MYEEQKFVPKVAIALDKKEDSSGQQSSVRKKANRKKNSCMYICMTKVINIDEMLYILINPSIQVIFR